MRGDANGDGSVNVGDLTAVASCILGYATEGFDADAADADRDGNINVGDISAIERIILGF